MRPYILAEQRSLPAGPEPPRTVPAVASEQSFGRPWGSGKQMNPIPPRVCKAALAARRCRTWLSSCCHNSMNQGGWSGISVYQKESLISSDKPILRAFFRAEGFQSRLGVITGKSALYCENSLFFRLTSRPFPVPVASV